MTDSSPLPPPDPAPPLSLAPLHRAADRRPMSRDRQDGEMPDAEAQAIVRAMARDAERGRVFWDTGPDGERLRGRAFRVMLLRPLARAARALSGGFRRALGLPRRGRAPPDSTAAE